MSEACENLGIPVVGGNVSFYNETDGVDIHPTPVVGLLGLADPMPQSPPRMNRAAEGMAVWLVGAEPTGNLAGSSLQRILGEAPGGRPTPADGDKARQVIDLAAELAHRVAVLHDVSKGGLAVAIAEICIASNVGVELDAMAPAKWFSEDPHRLIAVGDANLVMPDGLAARIGTIRGGHDPLGSNGGLTAGRSPNLA